MPFMSRNECEEYFESIQRILSESHTSLTQHDRHRAMALIMYMKPKDISINRYLNLIMTDEDRIAVKSIAKQVFQWPSVHSSALIAPSMV